MEVSVHLYAPTSSPPGKEPLADHEEEAEWAPEPVWTFWRREKSLLAAGYQTPDRVDHRLRSIPNKLCRLRPAVGRLSFVCYCYIL